jgi:glycerate 2-kinase
LSLPASVRSHLEQIFRGALAAVAPEQLVTRALDGAIPGAERVPAMIAESQSVYLLVAGKAAYGMGTALERALGPKLRRAVAVIPRGVPRPSDASSRIEFIEAAHPIPDESSLRAARVALDLARRAGPGDLLVAAISGGASAMLAMPAGPITLADKVAVTSALLRAGAPIREFNLVRKHLSAIKGGNLLRACGRGARVLSLIISDVPGNDLATIGSGLTAADSTTYAEAIGVLKRYPGLWGRTPEPIREHLERGLAGAIAETVKPGDPELERVTNLIIGDNAAALDGAEQAARALGYAVDRWRTLRGEANDLGRALAAHLCALRAPRLCVLAGGEPVVTVAGPGQGGRAQQCALALALELARLAPERLAPERLAPERLAPERKIAALFAGSDGIDGPTDAAGAFATPDSVAAAAAAGVDAESALRRNDSHQVFKEIGDLLVTGPTGTNVADLFVGLVNY